MNKKIKNIILFISILLILVFGYFFLSNKKDTGEILLTSEDNNVDSLNSLDVDNDVNNDISSTLMNKLNLSNQNDFLDKAGINEESKKIILALRDIKEINLDNSIFSKKYFNNLKDRTQVIKQEGEIGRDNPFEPFFNNSNLTINTDNIFD